MLLACQPVGIWSARTPLCATAKTTAIAAPMRATRIANLACSDFIAILLHALESRMRFLSLNADSCKREHIVYNRQAWSESQAGAGSEDLDALGSARTFLRHFFPKIALWLA